MTADRDGAREERDRRVKEIFERVLDAPPDEREALIARECAGQSIQSDVEALLGTEPLLGGFLETPASHRIFGAQQEEVRLAPGDEVAEFTVTGVLGDGGGGVVYEAEQREPKRRVALKLIRVRAHSGGALGRFRDEAANLARLHHSAIAHVYAAGVRERDGRAQPWIAMERVAGARSLIRYAREEALGRDARLRLFLVVCEALHHAHENGVIHRDVTPGNVLVDRDGRPKVVDFGIAHCAAEEGEGAVSGGTLAYASPEQLAGGSGRPDRRTDVYGLGALLHELLTGSVPLDVDDRAVAEVARLKRTERIPPPSSRAPGIPRDLDAIVLRALEPDPAARYDSAASLAADVARFLAHEPVEAFGGGASYQLAKFVRRRRAAAAAIAGIAAALVAGTAVSVWFAVENAAARDFAERRSYFAEIAAAASALRVDDTAEARRRLDRAPPRLRDWEWRHLASRLDESSETVRFTDRQLLCGSLSADGGLIALSGRDKNTGQGVMFAALASRDGTILRDWRRPELSDAPTAALSPDGRRFAAGFGDGRVLLCDVATLTELPGLEPHAGRVIALAFSPDGTRFATACADGTARIWSSEDGAVVRTLSGHPDRVICVAFDPAGGRLVTGCRDGSIHVWDLATGEAVRHLTGHEGSVDGVAVSPDGTRLASVGRDQTVRLWDLADGASLAVGRSHSSNVRDVAFDPRGRSFVSASWDGTLRIWDARTGAETGLLRGHGAAVTKVAFTASEPRLVSFSEDGTMKRWDVERTDVATCREAHDQIEALSFDKEGTRVAAAGHDGNLLLLDARTARVTARVHAGEGPLRNVKFLDSGSLLLLTSSRELELWDAPADGSAPKFARRLSPAGSGGTTIAVDRAGTAAWYFGGMDGAGAWELTCVDVRSGDVLEKRPTRYSPGCAACDGRGGLAVGSRDGTVEYCAADGARRSVKTGERATCSVAFDEPGERIVTAFEGGTAVVLRTSDLATLLVLRGHSGDVYQAEFLPGGRRIATVSRDHTVRLWDAGDGENVLVLHEHGYIVTCVAVSRDGVRIATAAGTWGEPQTTIAIWAAPPPPR